MAGRGKSIERSVMNGGRALFAAFAMLLNYQRIGKMKGMCEIVEGSIRDEKVHGEGMSKLCRNCGEEHPRVENEGVEKK